MEKDLKYIYIYIYSHIRNIKIFLLILKIFLSDKNNYLRN